MGLGVSQAGQIKPLRPPTFVPLSLMHALRVVLSLPVVVVVGSLLSAVATSGAVVGSER